jgi:hypothetical protein
MTSTSGERVAAPVREIGGFFAMSLDTLVYHEPAVSCRARGMANDQEATAWPETVAT